MRYNFGEMGKILLVEDDKSLREIYGIRLQAEGYEIVSAENGETALASAISEMPDLIISDVMMPRISGFEMLDLLRGNDKTKNIKVIMMTALSSDNQKERGQALGADRYLVKSQVGIEDLVAVVHEVLGDANNSQEQQNFPTGLQNPENTNFSSNNSQTQENFAENNYPDSSQNTANYEQNPATNNFPPSQPSPNQSPINPLAATAPTQVSGAQAPELPNSPMNIPAITDENYAANFTNSNQMSAEQNSQISQIGQNFRENQFSENTPNSSSAPNNFSLPPVPTPDQKTQNPIAAGQIQQNFDNTTKNYISSNNTTQNDFSDNYPQNINSQSSNIAQNNNSTQNSITPPQTQSAALDIDSILANAGISPENTANQTIFPNQN